VRALFESIDLLLIPCTGIASPTLERIGRMSEDADLMAAVLRYTCPFDMTGSPTITLPGGFTEAGMPVAFQFVARDASEVQNAFTYGGATLLQYPPGLFAQDLVRGVTFVFPLAFVNWLPALYVLGRPYPLDLPEWVAFLPPLVAAGCCALAGLAWRAGLRSYRSTGS
jgi:ABC-2 type transport system permease protein